MRAIDRRAHQILADFKPGDALTAIEAAAVIDAWRHTLGERDLLVAALGRVRRGWSDVRGGLEDLAAVLTPTDRKSRR